MLRDPAEFTERVALTDVEYRNGTPDDALCISVLAMQVFLDTYAIDGLRNDIAREALAVYSPDAFAARLSQPTMHFLLAERYGYLLGFAEISLAPAPPKTPPNTPPNASIVDGAELVRLYVQRPFKRMRLGGALLRRSEALAAESAANCLWLTAWSGNAAARAFYAAAGYADVGATHYMIEGSPHENRIFVKTLNWAQ